MHITNKKGDMAFAKVCLDLMEKGYELATPISHHLPYDLIAKKGRTFILLQIKYSGDGFIRNKKRAGSGSRVNYADGDFDYYAIYNPIVDRCIYPSFKYGGSLIRFEQKNYTGPYLWWEDFLDFKEHVEKRTSSIIIPTIDDIKQLNLNL